MATSDSVFVCTNCDYVSATWEGKCPGCQEWDTFEEREESDSGTSGSASDSAGTSSTDPKRLSNIEEADHQRRTIGVDELDQLFGGGVVDGAVTLIGGEPGIGKSTLLLQICHTLSSTEQPALYVSAEESESQTAMRARRLNVQPDRVELLCETRLSSILGVLDERQPPAVVVDSIQMIRKPSVDSSAGSVVQIRECTNELVKHTKPRGIPLFVVGHVTKEGTIAGPKTMEHMVDTVLYFEGDGDQRTRMLRSVKNRFGSTNSVALLEMTGEGLKQVKEPSSYFLEQHDDDVPGWISVPTRVGNRTLTLEVQALTSFASYGNPARRCTGLEFDRMTMVMAVLKKRAGMSLGEQDVYVNVAGGVSVTEPAADLPMALSIASSFRDQPVPPGTAAVGEIGLAGEIRDVDQLSSRINEAERLGFDRLLIPDQNQQQDKMDPDGLTITSVSDVTEALDFM
jgi:DNA repair protein RadA/Sms